MTKPYTLYRGDCLEVMRTLPDNSVDAIVCDPPYGLSSEPEMREVLRHWLAGDDYHHKGGGFMGKSWDSFVPGPAVWKEALRVLKPGGHLLAFFGTRTQDIGTLAIRLAGFEIRDCIDRWYDGSEDGEQFLASLDPAQRDAFARLQDQGDARLSWGYGSGFPKSMDVSKALDKAAGAEREIIGHHTEGRKATPIQDVRGGALHAGGQRATIDLSAITAPATDAARQWEGWGTALKPAHEPICVARKPLIGTVAANVLAHGVGALNIGGNRVAVQDAAYARNCSGDRGHHGTRSAGQEGAANLHAGGCSAAGGRWPANVVHDGSAGVVGMFPAEAGAAAPVHRRASDKFRNSYGAFAGNIDEAGSTFHGDTGTAARFFYCAKTTRADRNEGLDDPAPLHKHGVTLRQMENAVRDGIAKGNIHPTVKPTALMAHLVRLVTPPGGVVLDPYMGSGSTGKGCMRGGFRFIGIDTDVDQHGNELGYLAIAEARIEHELARVTAAAQAAPTIDQLDLFEQSAA
jgi:hypothetical protein